jgi:hypothetical protein
VAFPNTSGTPFVPRYRPAGAAKPPERREWQGIQDPNLLSVNDVGKNKGKNSSDEHGTNNDAGVRQLPARILRAFYRVASKDDERYELYDVSHRRREVYSSKQIQPMKTYYSNQKSQDTSSFFDTDSNEVLALRKECACGCMAQTKESKSSEQGNPMTRGFPQSLLFLPRQRNLWVTECVRMAAGSWACPAAERRIGRTQLFVFVASLLWNHVASLVNATPFAGVIHASCR